VRGNLACGWQGPALSAVTARLPRPLAWCRPSAWPAAGPAVNVIGECVTEINVTSPTCFRKSLTRPAVMCGDVHRCAGGGFGQPPAQLLRKHIERQAVMLGLAKASKRSQNMPLWARGAFVSTLGGCSLAALKHYQLPQGQRCPDLVGCQWCGRTTATLSVAGRVP
jgi:hypothetical protein